MKTAKEHPMTLEDFQKKVFWISLYITTPIIAIYLYLYL